MATADLAVPYEAPKVLKTMAVAHPMAPKKDCRTRRTERVSAMSRVSRCDWGYDVGFAGR